VFSLAFPRLHEYFLEVTFRSHGQFFVPLMRSQGGHDNGYTSTLSTLENEGLLQKLVLLRGYKTLATELQHFDLPHLDIGGVFMTKKLPPSYTHRRSTPPTGVAQEYENQRIKNFLIGTQSPVISSGTQLCRYLDPALVRPYYSLHSLLTMIVCRHQPLNKRMSLDAVHRA